MGKRIVDPELLQNKTGAQALFIPLPPLWPSQKTASCAVVYLCFRSEKAAALSALRFPARAFPAKKRPKRNKKPPFLTVFLVEHTGLEPVISTLPEQPGR